MYVQDLQVFADYFHIYLQDEQAQLPTDFYWKDHELAQMIKVGSGFVAMVTARNATVPLKIIINETGDKLVEDRAWFDSADQITECTLELSSGMLVILGPTDYFPTAYRFRVKSKNWQLKIYYNALESVETNGLEGKDNYIVYMQPGESVPVTVLKQRF